MISLSSSYRICYRIVRVKMLIKSNLMMKIEYLLIDQCGLTKVISVRHDLCTQQIDFVLSLSILGNATLISEALRHYQRVERQQLRDKQQRCDHLMIKLGTSSDVRTFDPIELRRKQCSSTLIEEEDEEIPLEQTTYLSFVTDISSDQRLLIIREMYRTESIYIEQLRDLIELITDALQLFTKSMHRRNELFSGKQIITLLGYMDEIFDFQQTFFHIFQRTIEETQPEDILISRCFLRYVSNEVHHLSS